MGASSLAKATGLAEVARDGYCVVLNLPRLAEQQSPYRFEAEAFEIWSLIDGSRSERGIVDALATVHGVDRVRIAESVRSFVAQLIELGLVTADEGDARP